MKIDSALKQFAEKYDRDAMQSIEDITRDLSLTAHKTKIKVFTIKEGFENFAQTINGYAKYKIENVTNEEAMEHSSIVDHLTSYINEGTVSYYKEKQPLFQECEMLYESLPVFVESYIKGVKSLLTLTDSVKGQMMEAEVDDTSIRAINEFMDMFMDKLHESFDPAMNKILWATGYNGRIKRAKQVGVKELKPVFL